MAVTTVEKYKRRPGPCVKFQSMAVGLVARTSNSFAQMTCLILLIKNTLAVGPSPLSAPVARDDMPVDFISSTFRVVPSFYASNLSVHGVDRGESGDCVNGRHDKYVLTNRVGPIAELVCDA